MFIRYALLPLTAVLVAAQPAPAPTQDRVGFPSNYTVSFRKLLTFDRPDNGQIRVIWANQAAAATPSWESYPYGSVILFESWTSKRDSSGNILLDENGRFIPDTLSTLFVKRKEFGFGEAYQNNRNGEWEYIAYRPDGTTSTAPPATGACAVCHLDAGAQNDFTFRRDLMHSGGTGAAPLATMSHYRFIPGDLTVKPGTVVTWYNDDQVQHQINSPNGAFNSNYLTPGASYSKKFVTPGEYDIRCTIHAGMRGKVIVKE
ncbi:MAG: cytochrome P460 family protein [Acidobacteria bacterium]|nr:cytochrome P460 family protein [Acidobacteriota bacterium]